MFWLARLIRLVRPMPPTPTAAMLSVSLGGVNPRPRTCLGTMAHAAPPAATLVRKVRREISFFLRMIISPGQPALSRALGAFVKASFKLHADQKEGGRWLETGKARSRAMPTRPRVPSAKRRPIRVMPWGTRRGGENFGSGFFGSGDQSERASETSTKPARRVSEG